MNTNAFSNKNSAGPDSGGKKNAAGDTLREGIAYLIFGVLTTAIDYVISNLLFYGIHMASVPAQTIAWIAAVLFAYVTKKSWVL